MLVRTSNRYIFNIMCSGTHSHLLIQRIKKPFFKNDDLDYRDSIYADFFAQSFYFGLNGALNRIYVAITFDHEEL